MKNTKVTSAVSAAFFSLSSLSLLGVAETAAANSFDDAIKKGTTSGQFRLAYISLDPDVAGAKTTTGAAFGGQIKFETAQWNHLQFAIAPYFSQKLDALTGDKVNGKQNGDLFDSNSDSFAYLGEAYLNYAFNDYSLRLGRQPLDTPFINGDDIRMFPNTFSGAWLNLAVNEALIVQAGVISDWAGFDSGGSQDKFKKAGTDGVSAIGASYVMNGSTTVQAWHYNFSKKYRQNYLDASYQNADFEAAVQYSNYQETNASNVEGTVAGVILSYGMGPVTVAFAANQATNATGKSADLGLGGGNYYTSMDEMTIGGLTDASAQVFAIDYAVSEKFAISFASGRFADENKATTDTTENDIVLSYSVSDKLDLSFVHATVDNKANASDSGTNFSRQFAQVNYTF